MITSYVYLEHEIDDPDEEPHPHLMTCSGWHPERNRDLLAFELGQCGYPDHWKKELLKHPPGYYRIDYATRTESECHDYGEWFSYPVVDDLICLERSFKARLYWFLNLNLIPTFETAYDLFRPIWRVDFEYGGVGISSRSMFLPYALFIRYFTPKGHAAWGDNYTDKRLRRD